MSTFRPSSEAIPAAVRAYGVAFLSVTAAFAVGLLLNTYFHALTYVSLFLCGIMFAAWFGGLGPSLVATAVAAVYDAFLVDAAGSYVPRVALFVITALFIVVLSAAQRRSAEEAARVNKVLLGENAERRRIEGYLEEGQALSHTGSFGWKAATGEIFLSKEGYRVLDIDPHGDELNIELFRRRVHPEDRRIIGDQFERGGEAERDYEREYRWLTANSAIRHLHVRAHRMRAGSNEEEVVGTVMDVTDARRAQEALAAAQSALAHASRVATLGEMSASITHEVNQPLASMIVNGEAGLRWLDRDEPKLDEVRSAIQRMIRDAKRASEVVQRLRALARKEPAERLPIDLNTVIGESVALLQRELYNHRVVLKTDLAAGLPSVQGNRIELQQVVINLMVNGMQAMNAVTDVPKILVVHTSIEDGQAVVSVQDCGVGLEPDAVSRLFSSFFTTRDGGMGMGLSICRSIIEAHGGRIWASSNDGPGAIFRFALPLPEAGT